MSQLSSLTAEKFGLIVVIKMNTNVTDKLESLFLLLTFPICCWLAASKKDIKDKKVFKYVGTLIQGLRLANGNILRSIFSIFTSLDKALTLSK